MAEIPDEVLMAYVDRQLGVDDRLRVDAAAARDSEIRARLDIFRSTGTCLADIYSRPMREPVPDRLVEFVMNYGSGHGSKPLPDSLNHNLTEPKSKASWVNIASAFNWTNLFSSAVQWQMAAAATVILAAGAGLGWMLHGADTDVGGTNLVAFDKGHLFAAGPLEAVLENAASGNETRIGGVGRDAVTMRVDLTFKTRDQTYCREYTVVAVDEGSHAGLACRTNDEKWAIHTYVPTKPPAKKAEQYKAADRKSKEIIDTVVGKMMAGDALGSDDEMAALKDRWK